MADRTALYARGLKAVRRMQLGGTNALLYLLKRAAAGGYTELATTEAFTAARLDDTTVEIKVTEGGTVTPAKILEAFAVAYTDAGGSSLKVYKVAPERTQPLGGFVRQWSLNVAPVGQGYTAYVSTAGSPIGLLLTLTKAA